MLAYNPVNAGYRGIAGSEINVQYLRRYPEVRTSINLTERLTEGGLVGSDLASRLLVPNPSVSLANLIMDVEIGGRV